MMQKEVKQWNYDCLCISIHIFFVFLLKMFFFCLLDVVASVVGTFKLWCIFFGNRPEGLHSAWDSDGQNRLLIPSWGLRLCLLLYTIVVLYTRLFRKV